MIQTTTDPTPPKWPLAFMRFFLKKEYLEEIEGDMEEVFFDDLEQYSIKEAKRKYTWEVLKLMKPTLSKTLEGTQKLNNYGMLKNNLRIAFRSLKKQKEYTAINVFGLTISMAISMIIILFLIDQDRMDEHNANADRIYRVLTEFDDPEKERITTYATTPNEFNQLMSFNMNGAEEVSQIIRGNGNIRFEENIFGYGGLFVSPNFLSFFDMKLEKGDPVSAMQSANGVILSRELAAKLFGSTDPIGQLVSLNDLGTFSVEGTIETQALKTHLEFDLLLPNQAFTGIEKNQILLTDWEAGFKHFYNYVKLESGKSETELKSFLATLDSKFPEATAGLYNFNYQRLDNINLGKAVRNEIGITSPNFVLIFFIILGMVLMLSASFNYMNLAIARGLKRAKEVGIRKVIGAGKKQIIVQFLVEAQLVMFTSLAAAFLLLQVLVPIFNNLKILRDVDGAITMNYHTNLTVYLMFIGFAFIVGLVAGLYPALYLSSFQSLKVLKGSTITGKSQSFLFRKILVFCQFAFSVIFIITTVILYQQASIFANVDYGFKHTNMVNVNISEKVPYEAFRNELLKRSNVKGVSAVSDLPVVSFFDQASAVNKSESTEEIKVSTFSVDPHVIDNFDFQLIAGRNFMDGLQTDQREALIINEKAMYAFGFSSPEEALNQTIDLTVTNDRGDLKFDGKIIGVIKDFNYQFIFIESGPLVMNYDPTKLKSININIADVTSKQTLEMIEDVWREFDKVNPFEYETYAYSIADIDDEFDELVNVIALVSFLAIIIACLGQFSMVVHHVQLKVKEIGIRKVLGSSMGSLMMKLSKDFLIVIFAAVIVATPIAWKVNAFWTSKIYSAPDLTFFNISFGVIIILLMAFLTIFVLVRKAVNANPVESLKYE